MVDIAIAAQKLLNSMLADDVMDDGYVSFINYQSVAKLIMGQILNISIYMDKGQLAQSRLPFGEHKRAFLYQGTPDYRHIISLEASGDLVERLPNIRDEPGKTLVMGKVTPLPKDAY